MSAAPLKVLFICTHNRCRSILFEAVARAEGEGLLDPRSAGSAPAGALHPWTLRSLEAEGLPTAGLQSESWDAYENWQPDLVITVCDRAAGEACPLWFGHALRLHWGLADPSAVSGSDEVIAAAFRETLAAIRARIALLRDLAQQPRAAWADALKHL
jgi:arsenate reductase